jgi:hypothetical protein
MNRFKNSSRLWAATGLGLLVCAAAAVAADQKAAAENAYQQLVRGGDKVIKTLGPGKDFGWEAAYYLGNFVEGYQAEKDTAWLDAGVKAYDYTISKMSAGPDGYQGWTGYYQPNLWTDGNTGDAILLNHMLAFAELVLADETLKKTYGEAAARYVALAKHDFVEKWDKRGTWHEDGPYGAYVQWDTFCAPNDLKTWTKIPKAYEVGLSLPFNKQNDAGQVLLKLYRITSDQFYHDRAQKIFAFMKSRLQLAGDYYCWNYWEPFGPWDVNLEKKDTNLWIGTHPYSRYQAGEIHQIVEAYNTGIVFDQKDIERIINTNLKVMWNQDKADPKFVISTAQLPAPALSPAQQKAREATAAAEAKTSPPGCLWTALDQFSQPVRDLEAKGLKAAGLDRAYLENVTLKAPPGFARLYSKFPATPLDQPFSVVKSVTVAVVMPCIIVRGKPSIVLGKVRIPEDLEVAVYSADGRKKLLVLYQGQFAGGPSGHDGIQVLQWDGGDLAKGDYRIRWTVADGYREFPVTIAE